MNSGFSNFGDDSGDRSPRGPGVLFVGSLAAVLGVLAGDMGLSVGVWLGGSILAVLGGCFAWRRDWPVLGRVLVLLGVTCGFSGWYVVRQLSVPRDDVRQYAGEKPQLIEVRGYLISRPRMISSRQGIMGQFSYRPPRSRMVLQVSGVTLGEGPRRASGNLLVQLEQVDARLRQGQYVRCTGWLREIPPPANPGVVDYRLMLRRQDIHAMLVIPDAGQLEVLSGVSGVSGVSGGRLVSAWRRLRDTCARVAGQSLRLGMPGRSQSLALLNTMLLGQGDVFLNGLDQSFRRVGLAHLLSISGAHLGILLWLTWLVAKLIFAFPSRSISCVLVVLGLYLLVVPTRVPIVRAGIMAGFFCLGQLTGRGWHRLDLLGLACLVVLIWRPGDLYTPGFVLSFGVVGALMLFVTPVSHWLFPPPRVTLVIHTWHPLARRMADYVAVNLVAFLIALPLVAYDYQMISPWNMVLTIMAIPLVTCMLGLGYLKIFTGLIFPSLGGLLAGPTGWSSDALTLLVQQAEHWPGATMTLGAGPSLAWTIGTLGVVIALFSGLFAKRRFALILAVVICVIWLRVPMTSSPKWIAAIPGSRVLSQSGTLACRLPGAGELPGAGVRLHAIAVGNGSCFVLQCWPGQPSLPPYVMLFDCGSQRAVNMGRRTVVPVLQYLNIRRIDAAFLSHADIDHFGGILDVMASVPIQRIFLPPQMLAEAQRDPYAAPGFLLRKLEASQVPVQAISQGWQQRRGPIRMRLLWPPADFHPRQANDTSLVLSVRVGAHRLLLNGDIQQRAITELLRRSIDLHADVVDLPHHGSMVSSTGDWLKAVSPQLVIQSCSVSRLRDRPWRDLIRGLSPMPKRLTTARGGMITVDLPVAGPIAWTRFRTLP